MICDVSSSLSSRGNAVLESGVSLPKQPASRILFRCGSVRGSVPAVTYYHYETVRGCDDRAGAMKRFRHGQQTKRQTPSDSMMIASFKVRPPQAKKRQSPSNFIPSLQTEGLILLHTPGAELCKLYIIVSYSTFKVSKKELTTISVEVFGAFLLNSEHLSAIVLQSSTSEHERRMSGNVHYWELWSGLILGLTS